MIKNLILIAVIYFVYRAIKSAMVKDSSTDVTGTFDGDRNSSSDDVMIKDPQCGVYFPQKDGVRLKNGNETLHFCSDKCRDEYKKKRPCHWASYLFRLFIYQSTIHNPAFLADVRRLKSQICADVQLIISFN